MLMVFNLWFAVMQVVPGETALAFYTVRNTADYPVTGVATYNVFPPRAGGLLDVVCLTKLLTNWKLMSEYTGIYFNKIQCFCFEEQRLRGNEEIDMPVFFFIDPSFADDPYLESTDKITLSYTFFKTGDEQEEELARRQRKIAKAKLLAEEQLAAEGSNGAKEALSSNSIDATE